MYRLILCLLAVLGCAPAMAQTFPSPTFLNLTVNGTAALNNGSIAGIFTGGTLSGTTFTGGTFSGNQLGTLNLTGAGTALSVTNNATVSGTLSIGSNINLGTLVGAGSNVTIKTPNGSNIVLNPQGTANVQVLSPLQTGAVTLAPATTVWSGTAYAGQSAFSGNLTWTGTSDATANPVAFAALLNADRVDSSAAGNSTSLWIRHTVDSAAKKGPAAGLEVSYLHTAASGNSVNTDYTGISSTVVVSAGDGGSGTTFGNTRGAWAAINPVLILTAGATNTSGGGAVEADIKFGAVALDKSGISIVALAGDTQQATRDSNGLVFDTQSAGLAGFTNGISFGRSGGSGPPIPTTGTLIFGTGAAGAGFTVANGIDWHLATFSGNSWDDGHFQMSGAGEFIGSKITDPNSAPGAGKVKLTMEAGTNAGSCKLVARAGTSNTAVTVVDNVGSGC